MEKAGDAGELDWMIFVYELYEMKEMFTLAATYKSVVASWFDLPTVSWISWIVM